MKGYRTMLVAGMLTIIGSLQQIGALDLVPQEYRGVAIAVIGLVMAVLRLNTNTSFSRSE